MSEVEWLPDGTGRRRSPQDVANQRAQSNQSAKRIIENGELRREIERLRGLLKRAYKVLGPLEWCEVSNTGRRTSCSDCGRSESNHSGNCEISALLNELGGGNV